MFILSDTEIHRLVRIVIKDHELNLCRSDFNEHVWNLFEEVPGLELLGLQSEFGYLNNF